MRETKDKKTNSRKYLKLSKNDAVSPEEGKKVYGGNDLWKQEAFEKCWAHSPLRAASRPFSRCRYSGTVARRLRIDVDDNDNA